MGKSSSSSRAGGTDKFTLIVDVRTSLTPQLQTAIDNPKVHIELERKNLNKPRVGC